MICPACNGTGGKAGTYADCSFCNGTGKVADRPIPPGHVGITDPPPVPLHGPRDCQEHGVTVAVTWRAGDACPLCDAYRLAREARVEAGETMLLLESAEHRLGAAQAEAARLRTSVDSRTEALEKSRDAWDYENARTVAAETRAAKAEAEAARLREALESTAAEAAFRAGELAAQTGVPRDGVQGHWRTRGYAHASRLLRAIEAEAATERLREALEAFAEGDCAYGDGCPTFGSRHGECRSCKARKALEGGGE